MNPAAQLQENIVHEIESSMVHFLVKAILFRQNSFICSRGVNKLIISTYFWLFQGVTEIVVNQSLNDMYS